MKLQIPRGTQVGQDFSFWQWPGKYEDHVDDLFHATLEGSHIVCIAKGFGAIGDYGNGAIHITVENLFLYTAPEEKKP